MRVSIIIPCFNARAFLPATLASVVAQSHPDVQVIVVDDASSDGSADYVASLGPRFELARVPHGGAPRARNHGLARATGDAVVFLDADDLLAPDTVAGGVAALERDPDAAIAVAPWRFIVPDGGAGYRSVGHRHRVFADQLEGWLRGHWFMSSALLWRRAWLTRVGPWDELLSQFQDYDQVLRALVRGARLTPSDARGHVRYRKHVPDTSVSGGDREVDVRSRLRVFARARVELEAQGRLEPYRVPLGQSFHRIARLYWSVYPELARTAHAHADALAGRRAISGPLGHVALAHVLGLDGKERLAVALARLGLGRGSRVARARTAK